MSWAVTAVSLAITTASIYQQNKNVQAQEEAVVAQTNMMYKQQEQKMQEQKTKAGLELSQLERQKLKEQGAMRAAGAESGVAGMSPIRALGNIYMQRSLDKGTLISKEEAGLVSTALESTNTYLESTSKINQIDVNRVTPLQAAVRLAIAGGSGYMANTTGGVFGMSVEKTNQIGQQILMSSAQQSLGQIK